MLFLTTCTITLNFLPGFSSSPGWLLVTRTRGGWWCHYRGHWRSGPRHLSPRSRVCAQEWHCKDIHSHIHSHTPMHTPKKRKRKKRKKEKKEQQQNAQLTKHDAFIYWSSSCPLWWWATAKYLGRCSAWLLHIGGLLAYDRTDRKPL